ncbi:MAG TPA: hypothetical protein PLP29_16970 [Candidatus Ozemobacteraceae bacterium]|nr:hypothetical protein [Candidatus Ozemobacteraceae bacterium]
MMTRKTGNQIMNKGKLAILLLVLMTFPMIQNCGGSDNGGGTADAVVAQQLINDGWANVETGAYITAESSFKQAIAEPLTDAQRIDAYNGLGWAVSKNDRVLEAIPFFEIAAQSSMEAKVGLAAALIFRHQTTDDYRRAAELLGNMPPEKFVGQHAGLALSTAKVHALTALAYAFAGEPEEAKRHINKAAAADSMMVGTTVDRIDDAFRLLGWNE